MSYVESVRDKLRKITLVWIIDNQLGRRNLLPYVQGELELRKKPLIAAKARERMLSGKAAPFPEIWRGCNKD